MEGKFSYPTGSDDNSHAHQVVYESRKLDGQSRFTLPTSSSCWRWYKPCACSTITCCASAPAASRGSSQTSPSAAASRRSRGFARSGTSTASSREGSTRSRSSASTCSTSQAALIPQNSYLLRQQIPFQGPLRRRAPLARPLRRRSPFPELLGRQVEGRGPATAVGHFRVTFASLVGARLRLATGDVTVPPNLTPSDHFLAPDFAAALRREAPLDPFFGPIFKGAAAAVGGAVDRHGCPVTAATNRPCRRTSTTSPVRTAHAHLLCGRGADTPGDGPPLGGRGSGRAGC